MRKQRIEITYVKSFQQGSQEAFSYIYDYYKNSLFYFIKVYTKDASDAEDVLQETFIKVYKNIKSLKKIESFHSWLYTIAYNTSMRYLRNKSNSKIAQLDEAFNVEQIVEDETNIAIEYEKDELLAMVKKEFSAMAPKLSSVAQLRYFEELSIIEIAGVLSIPEGTVKRRLSRVRQQMKPLLENKGITPNKYFSIGGGSILYVAFREVIQQNTLPKEASQAIQTAVISGGGFSFFTSSVIVNVLAVSAISISGVTLFQASQVNKEEVPNTSNFKDVSYYQSPTNQSVEVKIELADMFDQETIVIVEKDGVVPFHLDKQILVFTANENGEYKVKVKDQDTLIQIKNVDKNVPVLHDVFYENNKLELKVEDEGFGIDYEQSYIKYNDRNIPLKKDASVEGDFTGEISIYLMDKVGNKADYKVHIEDI